MKLLYVGDPMCSWCYGFGRQLAVALEGHPGLELEILVGGVRPDDSELLDDAGKRFRLAHWARVEAASGLAFNRAAFLARRDFVYNTEPVCRTVVAARRLVGHKPLLHVFRSLQRAFYVDGRDTTDLGVLASTAAAALAERGFHVAADTLLGELRSTGAQVETRADFQAARELGVSSFPHLLAIQGDAVETLLPGYADAAQIDARIRAWARRVAPHPGGPSRPA